MDTAAQLSPEVLTDSILPSQYVDLIRRRSTLCEGEYRLLWAVLEDAVRIYRSDRARSNRVQRERFQEVRDWFEQKSANHSNLFDFRSLCEQLGIDADRLRKGLKSVTPRTFDDDAFVPCWVQGLSAPRRERLQPKAPTRTAE
jgi:hypothetical protein